MLWSAHITDVLYCFATHESLKVMYLRAVLLMKYFFDRYGFTSSGAIAALVQGLLAKELWKRGLPKQIAGALHFP